VQRDVQLDPPWLGVVQVRDVHAYASRGGGKGRAWTTTSVFVGRVSAT
jgi:hypothetical protein